MENIIHERIAPANLLFGENIVKKMIQFIADYGEQATYNCCIRAEGPTLRDCFLILTNSNVYPSTIAQLYDQKDLAIKLRAVE